MTEQSTTSQQQGKSTKGRLNKFSKYPLYANETPAVRAKQGQKWIDFGKKNDYPDYLSYLYNNSGIHNAIVSGKAYYIFGKGWKIKEGWTQNLAAAQKFLENINTFQTLDELSKKAIFDRTLNGGCAYLIQWGMGKIVSIQRQAMKTIRTNDDCTEFYVSKEWTRQMSLAPTWRKPAGQLPAGTITYPKFDPTNKTGSQIYWMIDENPDNDVYPLPEYQAGNTGIETDIECGFFHLNNVKSGFSAGTMITFFIGTDDDDAAQDEIERDLKRKTAGTDNAGETLINWQAPGTEKPEISPLRSNELDKQYEQLAKDTINKILYSHRVTNGLLFGIKTPGELGGGRSEFDLAWEHFCNTYVKPKQKQEEDDINYLASMCGIMGEPFELIPTEPIGYEIDKDMVKEALRPDEKRKLVLDRLGLVDTPAPVAPVPAPLNPEVNKFKKYEEDILLGKFLSMGVNADEYSIVFEVGSHDEFASPVKDENVMDILSKNKKISVRDLSDQLKISQNQVYKILDRLNGTNNIAIKYVEKGGDIIIKTESVTTDVELKTMWRYTGKRDSKNRPFCRKMLDANRLYERSEIEGLQNDMKDFNTDVWKYKGGWYHDPVRDVNVPACRHSWGQVVVRKK